MIRNREAFTKKWALFCAGKQFTEEDMVFRGRIWEEEDFRNKDCERASVRFCTLFHGNLSGSRIRFGGDFTGNGWEQCQFTGIDYTGLAMEMDTYCHCMFGNARLSNIQMLEIKAENCSFAGSTWKDVTVRNSTFTDCNFRKVYMEGCMIEKTSFEGCMFDEAVLEGIKYSDVVFKNCRFEERQKEKIKGCIFLECTFENY